MGVVIHSLNILTISGSFYPKVDGSVVAVGNLAKSLRSRGHSVTVLTRGYGGRSSATWNEIVVERVYQRGSSLPSRLLFALAQFRRGSELLRTNKFDVIHAHGFASLLAAEMLRPFGQVPVVVTFHGLQRLWVVDRSLSALLRFGLMIPFEGLLAREADAVIAQSAKLKTVLMRLYQVKDTSLHVVSNPIDVDNFESHPANPKSKTVLFVGTFGRLYAPDLLIRAAAQVLLHVPEAIFIFVGQGPMKGRAIHLARQLGIYGNTKFVGLVKDRKELCAKYASARLLVIPFRGRGGYILSMAALEAMTVGRPVLIGYEVDATPGVIPMSNDPVAMANSIITLLNLDEVSYSTLCESARLSVEQFGSEKVAQKLEQVYRSLKRPCLVTECDAH